MKKNKKFLRKKKILATSFGKHFRKKSLGCLVLFLKLSLDFWVYVVLYMGLQI